MPLTKQEADVLRDVVQLHEADGRVIVHGRVLGDERAAIESLVVKGLLELRRTEKGTPDDARLVVPTPVGRRLVAA
jgi:hypothetical protein